jgi:hypothetical protein
MTSTASGSRRAPLQTPIEARKTLRRTAGGQMEGIGEVKLCGMPCECGH